MVSSEHLTEFHGTVTAEFALAGNYFTVADPAGLRLGGRIGQVYGPGGTMLRDLATPEVNRSLRRIDPRFQDFDAKDVVAGVDDDYDEDDEDAVLLVEELA